MGDYCKLIVSCQVRATAKEEIEAKIEELDLLESAYQSQERIVSIEPYNSYGDKSRLNLILVGQTKWGRGQSEFCEWLGQHVVQGSGENEVYAMSFSEYSDMPTFWKLS